MKQNRIIMGMPISVEIVDDASDAIFGKVFKYFQKVDVQFSTYKPDSEVSRINRGEIKKENYSQEMKNILALSEETKNQTKGYFNINTPHGRLDPSGLVKGWAIQNAANIIKAEGYNNFYVDAGGDVQVAGYNSGEPWRIGIKNPFNEKEIIKVIFAHDLGVATSGTYIRGQHIYNPHTGLTPSGLVSLTVIGRNVYEADRFATAAFAMGLEGIKFIEEASDLEGYAVDENRIATATSGFEKYTIPTSKSA